MKIQFSSFFLIVFLFCACNLSSSKDEVFVDIVQKYDKKDTLWKDNYWAIENYLPEADESQKMELYYIKGIYEYYHLNQKDIGIKSLLESKKYITKSSVQIDKKNAVYVGLAKMYFNSRTFELAQQNLTESYTFLASQSDKKSIAYQMANVYTDVVNMGVLQEEKKSEEAIALLKKNEPIVHELLKLNDDKFAKVLIDYYYTAYLIYFRLSEKTTDEKRYLEILNESKKHLDKSINLAVKHNDFLALQNFRTSLAVVYINFMDKNPEQKPFYIREILTEIEKVKHENKTIIPEINQRIYQIYSYIYAMEEPFGDVKKLKEYTHKNDSIKLVIRNKNANINNVAFVELTNQKLKEKNKRQTILQIGVPVLVILILGFVYFYIRTKQQLREERSNFQEILKNLENNQPLNLSSENQNTLVQPQASNDELLYAVSSDIEEKILKGLQRFVKNEKYRNTKLTQSSLSKELQTNPKYLSETIKKNFDKNFNNYINDLRIEFIINKLYNDEKMRHYKVSYLAEYAGFSSYETFKITFKNRTKMLPSSFIKFLNKDDEERKNRLKN